MAERKYTHGLKLSVRGHVTVLGIGDMEIWDGADLSLVRDTIFRLVREDDLDAIGIDISCVQHVPSGFFGMLYDWHERGVEIHLYGARERVQQMLWFRKFFRPIEEGVFLLIDDGLGMNEEVSEELCDETSDIPQPRMHCFAPQQAEKLAQ